MSWSNVSASRVEITRWRLTHRLVLCAGMVSLASLTIAHSSLPIISFAGLPLICAAVWWATKQSSEAVLLLSSNSDQLKFGTTQHALIDFAQLAGTVALRLEDGKGMQSSVLLGPWNSSAEQRRQVRLWLARHGAESTR